MGRDGGWSSMLRPPTALLARLRWFFLAFSLFFLVTFVPQVTLHSDRTPGLRAITVVLMAALGLWWLRCYRAGRFPLLSLVVEIPTFVLVVLVPDDPFRALGLLYIGVNFRALYGTWRRVCTFTVVAVASFSGAVIAAAALGGPDRVPLLMQSLPGVPVLAVIAHLVAVASERGERATARERVLSRSGVAIALSPDEESVRREALAAVGTLAADLPDVTAEIVLAPLPSRTPPDGLARLALPLRTSDRQLGTLAVDSPTALPMEVRDALEALAAQLAMGLENARLATDLRHRATHDALTGLANRALLDETLRSAVQYAEGDDVAVLLLDLDGFKDVNDTLGHASGDDLLVTVARRLRRLVRRGDLVARLGGDEFLVLLTRPGAADRAIDLGQRVVDEISRPVQLTGRELSVGVSVGVSVHAPGQSHTDLLRSADAAMYQAKQSGKGRATVAGATRPHKHVAGATR